MKTPCKVHKAARAVVDVIRAGQKASPACVACVNEARRVLDPRAWAVVDLSPRTLYMGYTLEAVAGKIHIVDPLGFELSEPTFAEAKARVRRLAGV